MRAKDCSDEDVDVDTFGECGLEQMVGFFNNAT